MHPFSSYVALGDSFTEGVGDHDPTRPHEVRGWADRVAEVLASGHRDFAYANLAIRGRKLRAVLDEQLEPALEMRPALVSLYAGGNDIMRPSVDLDDLVAAYRAALERLRDQGAHLVLFTGFDLGWAPLLGRLRGRFAIYNELVREVAADLDATLVDLWRMREYQHPHLWAVDRIHMSTAGHERMAAAVLDALGVEHDLSPSPLPPRPRLPLKDQASTDLAWAKSHAAPWVHRRLTGRSSGDGLTPRYPTLTRLGDADYSGAFAAPPPTT